MGLQHSRWLIKALSLAIFLFFGLVTASSWLSYDFFKEFITPSTLLMAPDMLQSKAGAGIATLASFNFAIGLIALLIFSIPVLVAAPKFLGLESSPKIALIISTISLLYVGFLQHRFYHSEQEAFYQLSPITFSHPAAYFIKSPFITSDLIQEKHLHAAKFFQKSVVKEEFPFLTISHAQPKIPNQKNVIVLFLESVRAAETGFLSQQKGTTPNLDRIAQQSLSFSNFYANSSHTVRAEVATLCSVLDMSSGAPLSRRGLAFNTPCLPNILKKQGYRSLWYHGYTSEFYNRDQFHLQLGFDELIDQRIIANDKPEAISIGWGISDKDVLNYAFEDLSKRKAPFFAEILTLTNHFPFDNGFEKIAQEREDENLVYNRYLRSIHYTDQALGEFWDNFQQSPLAENTILIILADHGLWMRSKHTEKANAYLRHEMQFKVPLLIWQKGI
ncbi:MAG: LTA synthase family protein, partial [Cellvibrionales bacterium]|nr:LTA synthase family protein [Cellvibrionales bacterium]